MPLQNEHPLGHIRPEFAKRLVKAREAALQVHLEPREAMVPFRVLHREPLLELRVEAREVQFVEPVEAGAVCGVHGVEPVDELIRKIVANFLIEAACSPP